MKAIALLMLALMAGCTSPAPSGQDLSPDAVRGTRIESFFVAFSSGDESVYEQWLIQNRTAAALAAAPMGLRLEQYQGDWRELGKLSLLQMHAPQGTMIEADAESMNGMIAFMFEFEAEAPYKIEAMNLRIGGAPGEQAMLPEDWDSLDDLAKIAQQLSGVPGLAIGVFHHGRMETAVAGERLLGSGDPVRPNDSFHWGSVGKSVTGTVIGALIDRGLLDWATTIGDVYGDAPMQPAYRAVKIYQLMAHQSGAPAYTQLDDSYIARINALPGNTVAAKRAAFVREVLQEPPVFSPGSQAQYSNAGVTIAGNMAEIVSGKTWEDLVLEFVFQAAAMTTGGFGDPVTAAHPVGVRGHYEESRGEFEPQSMDDLPPDVIAPAGGVQSSIADMLRYGVMHLAGMKGEDGVISARVMQGLHTPRPGQPKSFGEDYTFGWGARCPFPNPQGLFCQAHNGGNGAFFAELVLIPEKGIVIAYLANSTPAAEMLAGPLVAAILARYQGND